MAVRRYRPINYPSGTAEVNDLSAAVTWANVPDANITQSSVTQHQAALSITESQISDLGTYLSGSIGDTQIGFGSGTSIAGSANLTWDGSIVNVTGEVHASFAAALADDSSGSIVARGNNPYIIIRDDNGTASNQASFIRQNGATTQFGLLNSTGTEGVFMSIARSNQTPTVVGFSPSSRVEVTGGVDHWIRDGGSLRVYDSGDSDYLDLSHDGADLNFQLTNTTNVDFQGMTNLRVLAGGVLKVYDSTSADQIQISHGGTDATFNFTNTTDLDITGLTGSVVIDSALNSAAASRSISASTNTTTTDYGLIIRLTGGTGQTLTLDSDPPTDAWVLIDNSSGNSWTIAASTSLIWAEDATTGNRTLADDGIALAIHRGSGTWIINGSALLT